MNHLDVLDGFILEHWKLWNSNNDYLRLGSNWETECPPLWFILGKEVATRCPLVIISMEPLKTDHFGKQVRCSTESLEAYRAWQCEFFESFPLLTGQLSKPQRYWRTLHAFVAGFAEESVDFSWPTYSRNLIELPLVPLHAHRHKRIGAARGRLEELLVERINIVRRAWPDAVFVALGKDPSAFLDKITTHHDVLPLPERRPPLSLSYGERFWEPVEVRTLNSDSEGRSHVYCRRSPFAQGWSPRPEGRKRLGKEIRIAAQNEGSS